MKRFLLIIATVTVLGLAPAFASDIEALQPIENAKQAEAICAQTCEAQSCGWSGEWKKGVNGAKDSCDCGPVRIIKIPGGVIRSQEDAVTACKEICDLNEAPWTGEWTRVPGAFDLCSCKTIGDWCEPKS